MIPFIRGFLSIMIVVLITYTNIYSQQTVAILDFDKMGDINKGDVEAISEIFRNFIIEKDIFTVMDRSKVNDILEEQNFQLTGATDHQTTVKVGELLNVNRLITGSVSKLGRKWTVNAKIIDVETGEIKNSKSLSEITSIEAIDQVILVPLSDQLLADYGYIPDQVPEPIEFVIEYGEISIACDAGSYPDPEILILHRKRDAIQNVFIGDLSKSVFRSMQSKYSPNEIIVVGMTRKFQDDYMPTWNEVFSIESFEPGDEIWFVVYDRDITKHEYIGHVYVNNPESDRYPIEHLFPNSHHTENVGQLSITFK